MNYYKIFKQGWSVVQRFNTIEEAQAFADTLPDGPYSVEYEGPFVPLTQVERLPYDMTFCQSLISEFLTDNRSVGTTQEERNALMAKFQLILQFAQVGDIATINVTLPTIAVDTIFTQERKDKYIQMITDYLAQFA